jgi:hypothetical protein
VASGEQGGPIIPEKVTDAFDRIAEVPAQHLKDRPVALLALVSERFGKMALQVSFDPIVAEHGVINIEQEYDED